MIFSMAAQTVVFLKAIFVGLGLGLVYDFLRALRWELRTNKVKTGALDGLFWLVGILAFVLFVLITADGNGRYYVFLGMGSGALLYVLAFSPVLLRLLRGIVRIIRDILVWVFGIFVRIVVAIYNLLCKCAIRKRLSNFSKKHFLFCSRWYKMK